MGRNGGHRENFSTEKNTWERWGEVGRAQVSWVQRGLGVEPGQKAAMSQATNAQLRGVRRSWQRAGEPGRGTTLTEDIAFWNQEKKKEQARVI